MTPINQVALVTGGASGLGEATVRLLAAAGATVAILDQSRDRAAQLAAEVKGLAFACDIADDATLSQAFSGMLESLGAPRIVVNCAGVGTAERIVGRGGPISMEAFEKVLRVNLFGTFNVLRLAASAMSQLAPLEGGERGIIVNTASVAAFEGQIGQAAYAASKGAIVAMTLPAARELARSGIRVMTIAPGIFATPMLAGFTTEARESLAAQVPFPPRPGEPSEYASLVAHFIGNSMLNGETIRLDGAIRMGVR